MLKDFVTFVKEQGIVGIAVGIAIGIQAASFVDAIVRGFINPVVGILLQGTDLTGIETVVEVDGEPQVFAWGLILQSALTFIATAFVVYFLVKKAKLDKIDKKK